MKGITIKLPEELHRRLAVEAKATGRSIAAVIRQKLEAASNEGRSVFDRASELAGSVAGSKRAATSERRKFRRS